MARSGQDDVVGTCCCSTVGVGVTSLEGRSEWVHYTERLYKLGTGQVVPLMFKASLPVLELSCHTLGDSSTHQTNQEQYADAPTDHRQDVVL